MASSKSTEKSVMNCQFCEESLDKLFSQHVSFVQFNCEHTPLCFPCIAVLEIEDEPRCIHCLSREVIGSTYSGTLCVVNSHFQKYLVACSDCFVPYCRMCLQDELHFATKCYFNCKQKDQAELQNMHNPIRLSSLARFQTSAVKEYYRRVKQSANELELQLRKARVEYHDKRGGLVKDMQQVVQEYEEKFSALYEVLMTLNTGWVAEVARKADLN